MKFNHLAAAVATTVCLACSPAFAGTTISPIGAQDYDTGVLGTLSSSPVFFYGGIRNTPDPVNTFTFDIAAGADVFGSLAPFGGKVTFESVTVAGPTNATSSVNAFGGFSFANLGAGTYTLNVLATNFKPGQLGFTGQISADAPVIPVPESSTPAMILAGLAAVGFLMRNRARG